MKAKKIDLKNYFVKNNDPLGTTESKEVEYNVKEAMVNIITSPQQKHKGFRQLYYDDIAREILNAKEDFIILDQSKYDEVYKCFDDIIGYSRNDAELLRRIKDAETVELEEKKEDKK
jgi:hypothetical protein